MIVFKLVKSVKGLGSDCLESKVGFHSSKTLFGWDYLEVLPTIDVKNVFTLFIIFYKKCVFNVFYF